MKLLVLIYMFLFSFLYALEIPEVIKGESIDSVFFDIDSQGAVYLLAKNNSNIYVLKQNGDLLREINIKASLKPKSNFFGIVGENFLFYNDYKLHLVNDNGELLSVKEFPIGCIPLYIHIDTDYVFLILPELFNKNNSTLVFDNTNLHSLGQLSDEGKTPMLLIGEDIIPYNFEYYSENINAWYLGKTEPHYYWIDRDNRVLKRTEASQIKKEFDLKGFSLAPGFNHFILHDDSLWFIVKDESNCRITSLSLK